ncbi:MAG: sarcosine oxidase subunit gamma [Pseudomonadota bacterium]
MAKTAVLERSPVNAGKRFANEVVMIEAAPPASRISLRATGVGITNFGKRLGFALPKKPHQTNGKDGRTALWLGPDEWLVIDTRRVDETMVPKLSNKTVAAIDISHRNTAFIITGTGAENTLNVACPRDLSETAFPVGTCSRTIFGKAEVVLWRTGKDTFHLECWRSFASYVWRYLLEGAKDAHV